MSIDLNKAIVLEKYRDADIPMADWDIVGVFGDILMCRFADVPSDGDGDHIFRDGILVALDVTANTWRVVEVLKKGPQTSDYIELGDKLMIPNDRGISALQQHDGKKEKLIFINEERVFCKVSKRAGCEGTVISA